MFTDDFLEEMKRLELPIIEVNTAMTEDELTHWATQSFGH